MMELLRKIRAARGLEESDIVIKSDIANVFTGLLEMDKEIAIVGDTIVGIGNNGDYKGKVTYHLGDHTAVPGFIDAHMHVESTLLTPSSLGNELIKWGTTTVIADPHEIANVLGEDGIQYMIENSELSPVDFFFNVPSCVPATDLSTNGATIGHKEVVDVFCNLNVLGLAEVMDFNAVINGDEDILRKIIEAKVESLPVDGHCPSLTGKDLNAYIVTGIGSDHECSSYGEALEKLRKGMHIFVREGSVCENLVKLLPLFSDWRFIPSISLCTDDLLPSDIVSSGHINRLVNMTNIDPQYRPPISLAVRTATLNTARFFGLKDRGAIAPGYKADIAVFKNFGHKPATVIKDGKVQTGNKTPSVKGNKMPNVIGRSSSSISTNFQVVMPVTKDMLDKKIRVIEVVPGEVLTKESIEHPILREYKYGVSEIVSHVSRDILKLAVVERHKGTGNVGIGFVKGFGLKSGAIASSVAHDHHNFIVLGTNDDDMKTAVSTLENGGGLVVVDGGHVKAFLPLPVAGLMNDGPIEEVCQKLREVNEEAKKLGCELDHPLMVLSFLGLEVIPSLKLTDKGYVDVMKGEIVPLIVD